MKKKNKPKKAKPDKLDPCEDKLITLQAMIALSLIFIFGFIMTISVFVYSSTEVIGIAGVFASWITAVVAFFFAERGARETVNKVTQGVEDRISARDTQFEGELEKMFSDWRKKEQEFKEGYNRYIEMEREQAEMGPTVKEDIGELYAEFK